MSRIYSFTSKYIVAILLGLFFAVLVFNAVKLSPTADEPAHIPAGYGYLVMHDYRFNIEHPPLIKYLAAVPLALDPLDTFPKATYLAQTTNFWGYQWQMGIDYLYASGNSTVRLLLLARLPMILLAVLFGYLLYRVAEYYWGRKIGLIALTLFVFSPNILANGNLVTTDMGVSLGIFAAIAAYSFYLKNCSRRNMVLTVIAIAFAFLAKFSAAVVLSALFIMPLYDHFVENKLKWTDIWKLIDKYLKLAIILFASFLIVYGFYLMLTLGTTTAIYNQNIKEVFPGNSYNLAHFFSNAPMLLRPIFYYITGFVYVMKHTIGGHLSFFMGDLSTKGRWYYFPVLFVWKNQLVFIPAVLTGLWVALKKAKFNAFLFGFSVFSIIYVLISVRGSLDIGIRYLIPIFPLLFIFAALSVEAFIKYRYQQAVVVVFLALYIVPTVVNFPNYLSYANYLVKQDQKYKYFGDSSLDWGQDLNNLKTYVKDKGLYGIKVDYFGGGAPVLDYIPSATVWSYANGVPKSGYLAISVTSLQFSARYPSGVEYFQKLYSMKPVAEIGGGSILIYKF